MESPKKKKIRWPAVLIPAAMAVLPLVIWIAWGNTALEQTCYQVTAPNLPQAFDGYRIALVSDLHNCTLDEDNRKLTDMLSQAQPDIIALTGDMLDKRTPDLDVVLDFVREAVEIAPCYYVTGNHEGKLSQELLIQMERGMTDLGVTILHDRYITLEKEGQSIRLAGIDDPIYAKKYGGIGKTMSPESIGYLISPTEYTVLLAHRPGYFDEYVQAGADLVLCGHMHGGQFRLPWVGGLFTPSQGFFPEYDAGQFTRDGTVMLVSRGIGNSAFPFRVNNRPELVIAQLNCPE